MSPQKMVAFTRNIVMCLCTIVMSGPVLADVLTFNDLTDELTFTTSNPTRLQSGSCFTGEDESCSVIVEPPSLSAFVTSKDLIIYVGDPNGFLSDAVSISCLSGGCGVTDGTVQVGFDSTLDSVHVPCALIGGCSVIEDGTVQTVASITWSDGTTDSIRFQSDVGEAAVPETSPIVLLLVPLVVVAVKQNFKFVGLPWHSSRTDIS